MTTFEKLKIIDTLSIDNDNFTVSNLGNQSIRIKFNCGCIVTQHGFTGSIKLKALSLKYNHVNANRSFFVELCKEHNK